MHALKPRGYAVLFKLLLLSSLGACSVNSNTTDPGMTLCTEPRPQICTQDYRPVCAKLKNGNLKTYANGCTACSDANVISYINNACEARQDR